MNLVALAVLALVAKWPQQDVGSVVVRAPADITQKEQKRLTALGSTELAKGSTFETPTGDLIVKVGPRQTMIVSKDSSLMGPVHLAREVFALAKKYGTLKLIPIRELSSLALYSFRRDLIVQYARYDINEKSSFIIQPLVEQSILLGARKIVNSVGPSSNLTQEERVQRREDFEKMLDSAPLVVVRSETEAQELKDHWPWKREGSFYDPWEDQRQSIEIERRGLEIFQGWYQFEMDRIDSQMFSLFANDPSWNEAMKGRSAKTVEELQKIAPGDYQKVKTHLAGDYDIYGFASPEKALDAFFAAKVSYRFSLKLLSKMEGSKVGYYYFTPAK